MREVLASPKIQALQARDINCIKFETNSTAYSFVLNLRLVKYFEVKNLKKEIEIKTSFGFSRRLALLKQL